MTVLIPKRRTRRCVLRGLLDGAALTLALPFFDYALDGNGTALAASGKPLPLRFGTWYWGMGHTPGHAVAERAQTGAGIGFLEETQALKPFEHQLNFFSGFGMPLDGRSNYTHFTGWVGNRTGSVPQKEGEIASPTLDLLVADSLGGGTRFKTIDASSAGIARENYSARSTESRAQAEISPLALYQRLFGGDFVDPNSGVFVPDPAVLLEKSVLSAFREQSRDFARDLGAADRRRLDEYFTSVRQLENRLALQLEKPEPNKACVRPAPPTESAPDQRAQAREIDNVIETHALMAQLLAMAVACNQTRVFNMVFTDNFANVRKRGETYTHHLLTHTEMIDPSRGYQPMAFWFNQRCSEAFALFLKTLLSIREGAGSVLDNCLIFAASETNYAKLHTIDSIPIWLAGKAGGRMKTGMHVVGGGDPITRVGFTAMKIMGVPLRQWGGKSLQTAKPINEIMV